MINYVCKNVNQLEVYFKQRARRDMVMTALAEDLDIKNINMTMFDSNMRTKCFVHVKILLTVYKNVKSR